MPRSGPGAQVGSCRRPPLCSGIDRSYRRPRSRAPRAFPMRRTTPNCSQVARDQRALAAALEGCDTAEVTRVLEDFVTPERAARLRGVLEARLDAVTLVMDAPHDPHNGAAVIRSCD